MDIGHRYQQPAGREIRVIEELLDHGKSKEALAHCDRLLKRDKNDATLLALKAVCLFRLARYQECLALCVQFSDRTPPITDVEAIQTLHVCYLKITRVRPDLDSAQIRSQLANLWIRATKAAGGNKVAHAWIRHSLRNALFEDFQKATILLARENPKSLEYHFWSIVGWFVTGEALRFKKPIESATFGKLARAHIDKLVRETPHDPASAASSGRWISTSGQLRLVVQILQRQRSHKELLSILDSPNLGIFSRVAMKDWSFVRAKIEAMEAEAMWEELWDFCNTLLLTAHSSGNETNNEFGTQADDWTVWKALLKSQAGMEDPAYSLDDIQSIASRFIQQRPSSRNARLALLECYCRGRGAHLKNGETGASPHAGSLPGNFLHACMKYFDDFCDKYHCFDDLRTFVREFNSEEWVLFRRHVSDTAKCLRPMETASEVSIPSPETTRLRGLYSRGKLLWLNAELNALKLDYMMEISRPKSPAENVLYTFIATAIRLYNWSRQCAADIPTTDVQPGDDACLLAAAALLVLGEPLSQRTYALQAAVLLEGLLKRSSSNSDAKILLVRIYTCLELGTRALHWYNSLRLKNMQYISLAHLMYTRISTIHPFPMPMVLEKGGLRKTTLLDPYEDLKGTLGVYLQILDDDTPKLMLTAFEDGAYDKVYEFFKFAGSSRHDFSRKMWILERRRIARLRGLPYDMTDLDLVDDLNDDADVSIYSDASGKSPLAYFDNRDVLTGADFEHYSGGDSAIVGDDEFAKSYSLHRSMPKPESWWLSCSSLFDMLCCLVMDQSMIPGDHDLAIPSDHSGDVLTFPEGPLQALLDMGIVEKLFRLTEGHPDVSLDDVLQDVEWWLDWFTPRLREICEDLHKSVAGGPPKLSLATLSLVMYMQMVFISLDILKMLYQLCSLLTDEKRRKVALPQLRRVPTERIVQIRNGIEKNFDDIMAMTELQKTFISSRAFTALRSQLLGREDGASGVMAEAMEELLGAEFVEHHVQLAVDSTLEGLDGVLSVKLY